MKYTKMNLGWEKQEDKEKWRSQSQRTPQIKKARREVLLLALCILMNNIIILPGLTTFIIKELNWNYELYALTSASGFSLIGSMLLIFGSITRKAKFHLYFLYVNIFITTAHFCAFLSSLNSYRNMFQNPPLAIEILRSAIRAMFVSLFFVFSDVCIGYYIYLDIKDIEECEKTDQTEAI
uniref:Uncharacterized protein n=1 Tax=Lepeophtheirus salmonis TaxID=72036 RepID=A0A0K2UF64_LEPSM